MGEVSLVHVISHGIRNREGLVLRGIETKRDLVVCPGQQALPPLWPLIGWFSLCLRDRAGLFSGLPIPSVLSSFG